MKKKITIVICTIFILMIAAILFWKIPIYLKLNAIDIPDSCIEIETDVILSDVYWLHIAGERVIQYDGDYEALNTYIQQNNSAFQLKNITVVPFFRDTSESVIHPDKYNIAESERQNYAVIKYYRQLQ